MTKSEGHEGGSERGAGSTSLPDNASSRAERRLIARALGGEAAAFDELVRSHYRAVHSTAFHLLGNHEDAEDLTQECFVRAQGGLSWFRGGSLAGWLRSILVHLARDRFRRAGRRPLDLPLLDEDPPVERRGPLTELRRGELGRLLEERIGRLPENLRVPLVLRTREGLSYEEISETTGVTPATARTQVMKARRALLSSMGPYLDGGDS